MHTKDEAFHGKQKFQMADAECMAAGIEKLILADIYFEDGAPVTGLTRLREGMQLLAHSVVAACDRPQVAPTDLLRMQLDAAVRLACAMRDELKRRGLELAIDFKEGIVLPLERAATAGGSK